jgi:hypothetical protein
MSNLIGGGRRRTRKPRRASEPAGTPLARLLETPHLERVVPQLAPETLHELIRHSGLDACGEIVALATPAQLASVFDLDLWRNAQPGRDEHFDADRFGEWLEMLADAGGTVAARTVAAMDEHLVVAGLSRYIHVLDPASILTTVDGEALDVDVTSHPGPECEMGGYLVRGITTNAWDAIIALLHALDADHPDRFHAVMRECRRLSNSAPEVDGLDELLMEPEQLIHDLALDREGRRSQQGYSTPADARAFLLTARRRPLPSTGAVIDTPFKPGLVPQLPRPRIHALIEYVRDSDEALYVARSHELAFLANTLAAGCSIQSRAFTPQEALDAATGVCNLGVEYLDVTSSDTFLMHHDLVSAFETGWAVLHHDVSMFAAKQLILALSNLQCSDPDIQKDLRALRRELTAQRKAGTPWRARDALDVIAMLDMPAWVSVAGLLDECPVIPAALTATLEGRTRAVSATAFEFISTRSQLGKVREFMARFLDLMQS